MLAPGSRLTFCLAVAGDPSDARSMASAPATSRYDFGPFLCIFQELKFVSYIFSTIFYQGVDYGRLTKLPLEPYNV